MLLRIRGKGNKDRLVPLPQRTLEQLRGLWRTHRSATWLFPAITRHGLRHSVEHNVGAVTRSTLQRAFRRALKQSGVTKRSEEHTSELQSRVELVCRLLLEKKSGARDPQRQVLARASSREPGPVRGGQVDRGDRRARGDHLGHPQPAETVPGRPVACRRVVCPMSGFEVLSGIAEVHVVTYDMLPAVPGRIDMIHQHGPLLADIAIGFDLLDAVDGRPAVHHLKAYGGPPDVDSFPTRRSSD